jgi:hypothetical protein
MGKPFQDVSYIRADSSKESALGLAPERVPTTQEIIEKRLPPVDGRLKPYIEGVAPAYGNFMQNLLGGAVAVGKGLSQGQTIPGMVSNAAVNQIRGNQATRARQEESLMPPIGVNPDTVPSAMVPGSAEQHEQLLEHQTPPADSSRAITTEPTSFTTDKTITPVSPSGPRATSQATQTQSPNVPAMQDVAKSLPRDPNKLKQTAEKVAQAMKQAKGTESEGFWRSIFQVVAGVADVAAKGLYGYGGREYTTQAERQLEQARQMAMLQAQQGFQAGESALDRAQTTSNIKLTGEQNANMQLSGHKFEAEQNRLDREFQKAQAEIQMAFQNRQMTQVEKNQQEQALIDWYNAETARNESEYRIWLSAGQPAGGFDFKGAAMEDTVSGGR